MIYVSILMTIILTVTIQFTFTEIFEQYAWYINIYNLI